MSDSSRENREGGHLNHRVRCNLGDKGVRLVAYPQRLERLLRCPTFLRIYSVVRPVVSATSQNATRWCVHGVRHRSRRFSSQPSASIFHLTGSRPNAAYRDDLAHFWAKLNVVRLQIFVSRFTHFCILTPFSCLDTCPWEIGLAQSEQ